MAEDYIEIVSAPGIGGAVDLLGTGSFATRSRVGVLHQLRLQTGAASINVTTLGGGSVALVALSSRRLPRRHTGRTATVLETVASRR